MLKPGAGLVTEEVARVIVEFVSGARGESAERIAEFDVEPPLLSVICRELNERRRALGHRGDTSRETAKTLADSGKRDHGWGMSDTAYLPAPTNPGEYRRVRGQSLSFWIPAVAAIARQHTLPSEPITRFEDGESPVFRVGERFVLKLVPRYAAEIIAREASALRHLEAAADLPVPRPAATGEFDGWCYLVSSLLPGVPLHRCWNSLAPAIRLDVARQIGTFLRHLHRVPVAGARLGGRGWSEFVRAAASSWLQRWGLERLPERLVADGMRFLQECGFHEYDLPAAEHRVLHGDLAPENALFEVHGSACRISGVIDFGNAMIGDPLFDYTAPTVLLAPGDSKTIAELLRTAETAEVRSPASVRRRLMAYTLIHPMADLRDCLDLFPGALECRRWDDVAGFLWPGVE